MRIPPIQQEAIDQAENHGRRLVRWKGGFWTFEGARESGDSWNGVPVPEWYCRTNTVFALVRRGLMVIDDFTCVYLARSPSQE